MNTASCGPLPLSIPCGGPWCFSIMASLIPWPSGNSLLILFLATEYQLYLGKQCAQLKDVCPRFHQIMVRVLSFHQRNKMQELPVNILTRHAPLFLTPSLPPLTKANFFKRES